MRLVNAMAYVLGTASSFIMGWLIITDPVTKVSNYMYDWVWGGGYGATRRGRQQFACRQEESISREQHNQYDQLH